MACPVFRFAPSPNGALHLGHALSALLNRDLAAQMDGRLLLRIEDIDPVRCRPALIAPMLEDLAWLGLAWEEPVRQQSAHGADYRQALARLDGLGLLYPCYASRREIQEVAARDGWATDPDGAPLYPGRDRVLSPAETERRAAAGAPYVLRLAMRQALDTAGVVPAIRTFTPDGLVAERLADPARWGDVVLARKDVPASYHLCVVVDDALQGVSHVVRGRDLEAATDLHRLLQHQLGLASPAYFHHRLLLAPDGLKLSKSRGDASLAARRQAGATVSEIRALIGLG